MPCYAFRSRAEPHSFALHTRVCFRSGGIEAFIPFMKHGSIRSIACNAVSPDDHVAHMVAVAEAAVDAAESVTRQYFRTRTLPVDTKSDSSPVSIADKEAEKAMRAIIEHQYPEHAIFGEEGGFSPGRDDGEKYMWVIDPIDGTKSFITGKPLFGTLIALLCNGEPIVGIIDQPILRERWIGVRGRPTVFNGTGIKTRPCESLRDAYMYSTTPHMFSGDNEAAFERVRDNVRIPLYGCDCYAYGLLAAGHCDLVVEADLKPYDYLALVPIIEGAGGVITDWSGEKLSWTADQAASCDAPSGEVIAAGDVRCHKEALRRLDWR